MTEQRKLLSTKEAAEYCGFKLSYFRKLMMRRVIPMYKRQTVFLQERGFGRFPYRCPYLIPRGNCGGSRPLSYRQEVNNLFYSHQKQM